MERWWQVLAVTVLCLQLFEEGNMISISSMGSVILTCSIVMSNVAAQPSTQALLDQICHGPSATAAERQLAIRGAKDANVYKVLAERLPSLLSQTKDPEPLTLLAKLAGTLKLNSTIPVLCDLIAHGGYMAMSTTFYQAAELIDDPLGAALAEIGDPSGPAVSALLQSPNSRVRSRAVRVLAKIGSPDALGALVNANKTEKDPLIRSLIQGTITEKATAPSQKP